MLPYCRLAAIAVSCATFATLLAGTGLPAAVHAETVFTVATPPAPTSKILVPGPEAGLDAYERIRLRVATGEFLWIVDGRPAADAWVALDMLDDAAADGLESEAYDSAVLRQRLQALASAPDASAETLHASMHATDRALTDSVLRFLRELHAGRIDPTRIHRDVKLVPRYFDAETLLAEALASGMVSRLRQRAAPTLPLYARLRRVLADYRRLAQRAASLAPLPALPASGRLDPGDDWYGTIALRELLYLLGDLATPGILDSIYDPELVDAVRRFQHRHGLQEDGIIGRQTWAELTVPLSARVSQIELGLERLRWLPEIHSDTFVAVNIPAFRLWAVSKAMGEAPQVWQTRVVVGNTGSGRTPIFIDQMRWIEFNPYWHVPRSITRNEALPKLARDPSWLARQSMRVLDREGVGVDAPIEELIEGLADGSYRLRQDPGPQNSLGRVKFVLPNNMAIYLHDTPSRQLFQRAQRAFSHGCIRVEAPEMLAELLLTSTGRWPMSSIEGAIDSGRRTIAGLGRPIPVVLFYLTANAEPDRTVYFYPDIYGYDREALASLRAQAPARAR